MKRQLFAVALTISTLVLNAQTIFTSDMENLGLTNGQYYNGSTGGNGFQSTHAFFPTVYDTSFGGFWSSGWAASAVYDSSTAGFMNQYGCIGYKGNSGSNTFAVGTTYGTLTIRLTDSLIGKKVNGFYVNNSTYAYKSMRNGDAFARKFGDTTGTGCNCAQGTYPDWFKLTVKKYYGGTLQNDSVTVYLADYRASNSAQDYILKNWTFINLSSLGSVDSLAFFLASSDNSSFGMNTPGFFCLDDLALNYLVGIAHYVSPEGLALFPNPANDHVEIIFNTNASAYVSMKITDLNGREMAGQNMNSFAGTNKIRVDLNEFPAGMYYVTMNVDGKISTKKLVKQ